MSLVPGHYESRGSHHRDGSVRGGVSGKGRAFSEIASYGVQLMSVGSSRILDRYSGHEVTGC